MMPTEPMTVHVGQPGRAVMVPAVFAGGVLRRIPALSTGTPGVFLRRDVQGESCEPETCSHPITHGQRYDVCPERRSAVWQVTLACGLAVNSPRWPLGWFESKTAARAFAEALAAWPVDWSAPAAKLRSWAGTPAGTRFGEWAAQAAEAAETGAALPPPATHDNTAPAAERPHTRADHGGAA